MNRDITLEEVINAAGKVKLGKVVGIDQLPYETLKYGPVYSFMVRLFNFCFKCKLIPSAWQKGVINLIPKSSDKDIRLCLNYRCITLTCHMYKVYSTILNVRLSICLEETQILVEEQNGFRKMRSCVNYIFTLITTIENRYKRRQSTYICFVDMKKAFDNVNRTFLLDKLGHIGINGNINFAVKTIYEQIKRDTCNKVQQKALRYFLGIHSKTPILALEGDTGWLNTEVRRHIEMFRFWNHIIKMDATRLTRKVFETDYRICKITGVQKSNNFLKK